MKFDVPTSDPRENYNFSMIFGVPGPQKVQNTPKEGPEKIERICIIHPLLPQWIFLNQAPSPHSPRTTMKQEGARGHHGFARRVCWSAISPDPQRPVCTHACCIAVASGHMANGSGARTEFSSTADHLRQQLLRITAASMPKHGPLTPAPD